jgi:protein-tyrosine phosphatase
MKIPAVLTLTAALVSLAPLASAAPPPNPPVVSPHLRVLPLEGGQNFRDLGGYRTTDGRSVRWGLLYRSGSMHFLTAADQAYLEKLRIRTICDFRDTRERALEPAIWPAGHPPQVIEDDYVLDMGGIGRSAPGHTPTAADAKATISGFYPQILRQFNGQYRRMFDHLLAGDAPLAFNCTAGKDRTGVAAALLLTALGVPRETVVEDYTLTNRYFDPSRVVHGDNQASVAWKTLPPEVLKAYMSADPDYIGQIFIVMNAHVGGAAGYLRDELGLTPDKITTLRQFYTE